MSRSLCGIVFLLLTVAQPIFSDQNVYTAAVVQYMPDTKADNFDEIPMINVNNYLDTIENAYYLKTDIIVFPEFGLTGLDDPSQEAFKFINANDPYDYPRIKRTKEHVSMSKTEMRLKYKRISSLIPSPKENIILCDDKSYKYAKPLKLISCAARHYKIYVVVNYPEYFIIDKKDFNKYKIESNKLNEVHQMYHLYNTNIVFDRKGRVVARYRKSSLFHEPWMDKPVEENFEESTFTTDFGVTFGQIIGMDITSLSTAEYFKWHPHIENIILTTRQYARHFFLSSVQDAASWAYEANANVLVAGAGWDGGSGIYRGNRGPLGGVHNMDTFSNMLIYAKIPKSNKKNNVPDTTENQSSSIHYIPQTNLEIPLYNMLNDSWSVAGISEIDSAFIPDKTGRYTQKLCLKHDSLCCDFVVDVVFNDRVKKNLHYWYHMMIFQSLYKSGHAHAVVNSCAVVACPNMNRDSCGKRFSPDLRFTKPFVFKGITIRASAQSEGKILLPTAKEFGHIMIAGVDHMHVTSSSIGRNYEKKFMDLILNKPTKFLTTFGVSDRIYNMDNLDDLDPYGYANFLLFIKNVVLTLSIGVVTMYFFIIFKKSTDESFDMAMLKSKSHQCQSATTDFGRDSQMILAARDSDLRPLSEG